MLADVQQLDDRSQRMQIKGNSWVMKSHMNYRDGTYLLMKTSIRATDPGSIGSYDYYDWFWQGQSDVWMSIDEEYHFLRFSQYPIPRATVPRVTRATQASTYPYYQHTNRIEPKYRP